MALILSIETATPICSVALHNNGKLLAIREDNDQRKHAQNITVFIDEVVTEANIKLSQIDAVAVSKGPGSYTGLRIGVSAAKGLCYGIGAPLIAVNTLKALTYHPQLAEYKNQNTLFCPMIDARRMEVYCALYNSKGENLKETQAIIIDENSFEQDLAQQQIVFFGSGAAKCKDTLQHPNAIFIENIQASANGIGKLALEKYKQQNFEDMAYFEPFYLKEFVAMVSKK